MMFGHKLKDKLPAINSTPPEVISKSSVCKHYLSKKKRSKQYHDRKNKMCANTLQEGDTVFIHSKKSKLGTPWIPESLGVTPTKGDFIIMKEPEFDVTLYSCQKAANQADVSLICQPTMPTLSIKARRHCHTKIPSVVCNNHPTILNSATHRSN